MNFLFSAFGSSAAPSSDPHTYSKRLAKEYKDLCLKGPDGVKIRETDSLTEWEIEIDGAKDTLYENEQFVVRFRQVDIC